MLLLVLLACREPAPAPPATPTSEGVEAVASGPIPLAGGDCGPSDTPFDRARHPDADGDGFGDPASEVGCEVAPVGWVRDGTDCDDADPTVFPGGWDSCLDDVDQDCDGAPRTDCRLAGRFSLEEAAARIVGMAERSRAGVSVAGPGDVDGDGRADLWIGARNQPSDVGRVPGAAYLLRGPVYGDNVLSDAQAVVVGERDFHVVGDAVAAGGDLTGDGGPDLLVLSAWDIHVISGSIEGSHPVESVHAAEVSIEHQTRFLGIGDFDGDGFDDMLAGDPWADPNEEDAGAAYILSGPLTGQLTLSDASITWVGSKLRGGAGRGVGRAGDLDGDGWPEIAVAANENSIARDGGVVYLLPHLGDGVFSFTDAPTRIFGTELGERFGSYLDGAGDLDRDGYDDLLVGSDTMSTALGGYDQEVAASLVLGPVVGDMLASDAATRFLTVRLTDGGSGTRVVGPGDVDGDGRPDILIGHPAYDDAPNDEQNGAVYLFYDAPEGTVSLASADAWFMGSRYSQASTSLAAAGDVNGDGLADFIVGGPYYQDYTDPDPEVRWPGIAWLVLGGGW